MSHDDSDTYCAPAAPQLISAVDGAQAGPGLGADANLSEPFSSGPN